MAIAGADYECLYADVGLVEMGGCQMEEYRISVAYCKQLKMELIPYPLLSAHHMEAQRCITILLMMLCTEALHHETLFAKWT